MSRILLVEVGYAYFAWCATRIPPDTDAEGIRLRAEDGRQRFLRLVRDAAKALLATLIVLVRDPRGPSWRVPLLTEAQREERRERERRLPVVWQALDAALAELEGEGVVVVEPEGFDARDVVATIVARAPLDARLRILSGRLELAALAHDGVDIAREERGASVVEDEAKSRKRLPVPPEYLADYLALAGLPGIGDKTARLLVSDPLGGIAADACLNARGIHGLKEPQRRTLREATGEPIRRAVAVAKLRDDVAIDVGKILKGERDGEGKEENGGGSEAAGEAREAPRGRGAEQVREEAQGGREHGPQRDVGSGPAREAEDRSVESGESREDRAMSDDDQSYISTDAPLAVRPEPAPMAAPRASAPSAVAVRHAPAQQAAAQRPGPRTSDDTDILFAEIAAAHAEFEPLTKTRTAKIESRNRGSYEYKYANLADVMVSIGPALKRHHLVPLQIPMGDKVYVRLIHGPSGQWIEGGLPLVLPDYGADIQRLGSALTYVRRYLLTMLLGIVADDAEDDDGTAAMPPPRGRAA